ncbi:MAG TPA: type IV pili methyl-accepting chemotaxis transducer N-terminal domain-containing protein, partial [Flavobacterium sp.]
MKNNAATVNISFKNLKKLYLFALLTIAITVLLSQLLIQYNLHKQLNDSRIINTSGRQRMLSQKLTKEILILNFVADAKNNQERIERANEIIKLWKFNQEALENGNDSLGFPKEKSRALSDLFAATKPNFNNIVNASTAFLENKKLGIKEEENQELVQIILKNGAVFLDEMNQIVGQYDKEALEKVTLQSEIEYGILIFTMLVLLLEFIFIFKPTNKKIEALISKLLTSERKALKLARDTEIIGEAKENSVKELKSLNYAMENTLLYCRVAPDGSLIHIGEKFSKLLQYNPFLSDKTFSQV